MVNFKNRLAGSKAEKPTDPVKLYETLDRAHDKGPLRPAQLAVLGDWFANHQSTRDVIVKLHTGQGKTLIGLLMLQARLNAGKGPALYLCPDNFLIAQTCDQAKQFGITTCTADPELPDEFMGGEKILVTSVQKLFNGRTKFGLNKQSVPIATLLMDDAHACADTIREQCRIRIPNNEPAYTALRTLFATDLEMQGIGTYADICNDKRDALLPVPYWAWVSREAEIASILSTHTDRTSIKFVWPLLKDMLGHCQCIVSGAAIEIEPYIAPLSAFGSYWKAKHRVFMSATVTDDAFLVKGLQLLPETITKPLSYAKETWSGEKMVLLPSLIHDDLDRGRIVKGLAVPNPKRRFGVVALAPSFTRTKDWEAYGAIVAKKDTVSGIIDGLKRGEFEKAVVLVNRYDGIDLPDDSCRILVFDSKPYSESLARQEIDDGAKVAEAFNGLIRQCLSRDADWKAFYVEQMGKVRPGGANEQVLRLYAAELAAEEAYNAGDYASASEALQRLLDEGTVNNDDKGWYLQEMARYHYRANRTESQTLQLAAHKCNRLLLKPPSGVTVATLTVLSQGRLERIAKWVGGFDSYSDLDVTVSDILGRLVFGMKADKFEQALDELSRALGFAGERPDKAWKEGPDNLWALDATQYVLWECKSEVDITRADINKREAEQMNRSSAWFDKHYPGMSAKRIIIHPAHTVESAAAFTHDVEAMREAELKKFVKSGREFFKSFESLNFKDLSTAHIQKMVDAHNLAVPHLLSLYSKKLRNLK